MEFWWGAVRNQLPSRGGVAEPNEGVPGPAAIPTPGAILSPPKPIPDDPDTQLRSNSIPLNNVVKLLCKSALVRLASSKRNPFPYNAPKLVYTNKASVYYAGTNEYSFWCEMEPAGSPALHPSLSSVSFQPQRYQDVLSPAAFGFVMPHLSL